MILDYIKEQQDREYVGIPLRMPRLNSLIKCIDKGDSYIITAQTSTYKSAFTLTELVLPSVEWIIERAESGLDIKVFYFLLEENRQDLEVRILSYLIANQFNCKVSENQLHARGEKLDSAEFGMVRAVIPRFEKIMAKVDVFDNVRHSYGMYKRVEDYMLTVGTIVEDPETKKPSFVYNNPDLYVYFVVDHGGDMLPDKDEKTIFVALENLALRYLLRAKNFYRVIPFLVQQQENVGDKIDTDYKGATIQSKLAPSTAKLADNKGTARRATHVISLMNPATYELNAYKGYNNLGAVADNFLYLEIHKNRRGPKNKGSGIFVEPVTKTFYEFPPANDLQGQQDFINQHKNLLLKREASESFNENFSERLLNYKSVQK